MLDLYRLYLPSLPEVPTGKYISIRCPWGFNHKHNDASKSASIVVENGVFICAVCGVKSPEQFLADIAGISKSEAASIVRDYCHQHKLTQDTGHYVDVPKFNPRLELLAQKARDNLREDLDIVICYTQSRGISFETLQRAGVGYLPAAETHWKRDSLVFPYVLDGRVVGIRYRDVLGAKNSEPGCAMTLWGLDTMPETSEMVIVTEGESDRLIAMQYLDIPVVSTPTASFNARWALEFADVAEVFVIPDSDTPGQRMAQQVVEALPDKATIVNLPWRKREFGKDLCEWLMLHTPDELKTLINTHKRLYPAYPISGNQLEHYSHKTLWLINNLMAPGQVGIIAGQPKAGKTWMVLNLIRCLLQKGSKLCDLDTLDESQLECVCDRPNILLVEEESTLEKTKERIQKTLATVDNWQPYVYLWHRSNVKVDEPAGLQALDFYIKKYGIQVLILDPLALFHTQDENDAGAMSTVWLGLRSLLKWNPTLSIVVVHHYSKDSETKDRWSAIRGSSRTAAEVDWAIFLKRRPKSENVGAKISFDGREIVPIEDPLGQDEFKLKLEEGVFTHDKSVSSISKHQSLLIEMRIRKQWPLSEAIVHYGVSRQTIYNWVARLEGSVVIERSAQGRRAILVYVGDDEQCEPVNAATS